MANTANWIAASGKWERGSSRDIGTVPTVAINVVIAAAPAGYVITGGTSDASASLTLTGTVFSTGALSFSSGSSKLNISAGTTLTDTGALTSRYGSLITVNGGALTAGALVQSDAGVTLNGGTITVASIAARALTTTSSNTYTVTDGVFAVRGNIARGSSTAYDSFDVRGTVNGGKFIVDGSVALGSYSINAHNGGVIQFASVSTQANAQDTILAC